MLGRSSAGRPVVGTGLPAVEALDLADPIHKINQHMLVLHIVKRVNAKHERSHIPEIVGILERHHMYSAAVRMALAVDRIVGIHLAEAARHIVIVVRTRASAAAAGRMQVIAEAGVRKLVTVVREDTAIRIEGREVVRR